MDVIAYTRVSTAEQGKSGLGLDAQKEAIARFVEREGLNLVETYSEIESGKGETPLQHRKQLRDAMAHAKRLKCPVLVSKLDRLSRDNGFLAPLLSDKRLDVVTCEHGFNADKTMLRMHAVFAQHERSAISKRTIDALAAAKRNGAVLGSGDPSKGAAVSAARRSEAADAFARNALPVIRDEQARAPSVSLRKLAEALNNRGFYNSKGAPWSAMTLCNLLQRCEEKTA
jgi:DNA invertase Pin-like site-specific DNA recombinase